MIYYAVVIAGAYQLARWLFALVDIVEGGKRQFQRRLYRLRPPGYNKKALALRGKSIPAAIRSRDRKIQYTPSMTLSYCFWMWSWNSSLVIDRCRSVPFSTR